MSYYLVGVAPAGAAASEPGESRTEILGFAVVLFMLIALIPVVKLVLLGPVDTMKEIEVAAICVGIVAATAFGTALWIGVRDVLIARSAESSEIAGTARALVRNVERDLRDALFSSQMVELSQNFGRLKSAPLVFGFAPEADLATAVKVENLVLFDGNGRQAAGTVINAARNYVGANFDLSDRTYFRRALDEDFAPNGEHLLAELRKGHDACYIWNDTESGLVFDGVRSRTDGTLKAIMAARLRKPATSLKCGQESSQSQRHRATAAERCRRRIRDVADGVAKAGQRSSLCSSGLAEREGCDRPPGAVSQRSRPCGRGAV